jgi:hypothetical protein
VSSPVVVASQPPRTQHPNSGGAANGHRHCQVVQRRQRLRLRYSRRRREGSLHSSQRHRRNGFRSLVEGAKVSYDAESGDKGPKAISAPGCGVARDSSNPCHGTFGHVVPALARPSRQLPARVSVAAAVATIAASTSSRRAPAMSCDEQGLSRLRAPGCPPPVAPDGGAPTQRGVLHRAIWPEIRREDPAGDSAMPGRPDARSTRGPRRIGEADRRAPFSTALAIDRRSGSVRSMGPAGALIGGGRAGRR